mmetsp:Transcript_44868/g.101580  ORF Transcript_44868/g.101580 Transcript_44868/m.101580 type:complete len:94 (+) Transcript_44868:449-730(+)
MQLDDSHVNRDILERKSKKARKRQREIDEAEQAKRLRLGLDEPDSAIDAVRPKIERRIDPSDGQMYTKEEFLQEYNGLAEWEAAVETSFMFHS